MKSLFPQATSSFKNLGSYLKQVPQKIYSIEIKIKSQDKLPHDATALETPELPQKNLNGAINQIEDDKIVVKKKIKNETKSKEIFPVVEKLSQNQIAERTAEIVDSLKHSTTLAKLTLAGSISLNMILKQFYNHIQTYPEASNFAIRKNVISKLIKIRESTQRKLNPNHSSLVSVLNFNQSSQTNILRKNYDKILNENSRQALSLLGHTDPPKGRGVRILSIDGGGTRGIMVIEVLRQIERFYGQPIHKIFDLICGVSTGAIIAMLVGGLRISINECESFYRHVSSYLFKTDVFRGTSRLLWSHAYYDTAVYEKVLKEIYGETILINTKKNKDCPHMVVISAIVNLPTLEPYLFRNYELHPSSKPLSHFEGGSGHKIWEAVRASSAAPGYFEEFQLKKHVHQDGGILLNNPTAVAVHEAKLLWPDERIQCVISLGSGRYQPTKRHTNQNYNQTDEDNQAVTLSSLKHKILRLIDSATDTEMVHRLMQDMLPSNTYYRMNPLLRDPSGIDENRPEKLEQMKQDAQLYLRQNQHKFQMAMEQLKIKRTIYQSFVDDLNLKYKTYF